MIGSDEIVVAHIASYIYDGLGRRVAKNIDSAITKYVYDQEDILFETDISDSIIARYTHGPGIDEPVSMERGGSSYYYIADVLGSIAKVIDSVGNVINHYVYNSFGSMVEKTEGVANPYTYTGREYDTESGLYYYRARYYDAKTGRFLNEDPLDLSLLIFAKEYSWNNKRYNNIIESKYAKYLKSPLNLNYYLYVGNNPIKFTDPYGLIGWDSFFRWLGKWIVRRIGKWTGRQIVKSDNSVPEEGDDDNDGTPNFMDPDSEYCEVNCNQVPLLKCH